MSQANSSFNWFIKVHRWLALVLSPVLLVVILSGMVLAFKPIVAGNGAASVNVPTLIASLNKVDPQGKAGMLSISGDAKSFELSSRGVGPRGTFDMATGAALQERHFDVFGVALRLHKNLMLGAGWLVELATYAMLVLIVTGLLLGWPRLRNNLAGWHKGFGWLGLPLVVLTPVTAVMMVLHLGMPRLPQYEPAERPLPIARTLEIASSQADLSGLSMARVFRRGGVMISTSTPGSTAQYIVSGHGQLVANTTGPGWVRMLHEGTWAGAFSGWVNVVSAVLLAGLLVTGVWAWLRRRQQAHLRQGNTLDPAQTTLVAFASQTGTAAKLAEATAKALRKAGESVMLASLASLQPAELAGFRRTLVLASTTGEGDVPDPAKAFFQQLCHTPMKGSRFSLLALGDKRYSQFCGGGLKLRQAMLAQGAEEILPPQTVDRSPELGWEKWLAQVARILGLNALEIEPNASSHVSVRVELLARTRLDNPVIESVKPAWQLRFKVLDEGVSFLPGDLVRIRPQPDAEPRTYSVGSSSRTGQTMDLTVALQMREDARGDVVPGLCSSYLCHSLRIGERIELQLQRHAAFNPPKDAKRPLILIATGAGIASFPGFIEERKAVKDAGPIWLFFGNRRFEGDFYYRQYFETSLASGALRKMDTAFSRDTEHPRYIQQALLEHGKELLDWMTWQNAAIYVCGGAQSVGQAVDEALRTILLQHNVPVDETLNLWKAEGRLKLDLFA